MFRQSKTKLVYFRHRKERVTFSWASLAKPDLVALVDIFNLELIILGFIAYFLCCIRVETRRISLKIQATKQKRADSEKNMKFFFHFRTFFMFVSFRMPYIKYLNNHR